VWTVIGRLIISIPVALTVLLPSKAVTQNTFGKQDHRTAQSLPTRTSPGVGAHRGKLAWRAGRWHHTARNGRLGWWWDVGGVWYYYSEPIDGPPGYVSEVAVVEEAVAASPAAPPARRGPQQTFYYPPGSLTGTAYPTVEECSQARDRAGGVGVCVIK
jgi:hypothetical protein